MFFIKDSDSTQSSNLTVKDASTMRHDHHSNILVGVFVVAILIFMIYSTYSNTKLGVNTMITSHTPGLWAHGVVWHFSLMIQWLSKMFGNSYGLGIIAFTIIVRLILLPFMLKQGRFTRAKQIVSDKVDKVRKRFKLRDASSQLKFWIARQHIYDKSNLKDNRSGCVIMLLQVPIIWALYQSIWRSNVLRSGSFLWMQLGHQDPLYILPVLAAIFTLASMLINYLGHSTKQSGCSRIMLILIPFWILVIALHVPSAIAVYWVTLNAFGCIQSIIVNLHAK